MRPSGPAGARPGFVDVHSHVVPSLDDGARSVEEGLALCRLAYEHGTRVLFATPHAHAAWDTFPRTPERLATFEEAYAELRPAAAAFGLDLRRGWELFPTEVGDAVAADRLEGTDGVLVEFPGSWLGYDAALEEIERAGEVIEAAGLVPVLAHPERCPAACAAPERLAGFARRGWLLCLNAPSLLGVHGRTAERVAWELAESGAAALAASDGHRSRRPPRLDRAYAEVARRLGPGRALDLFAGTALLGAAEDAA